ncbi:hypothetical protein [uncultured Roseibium sp.]|uniref:hypothetical protein n=1 Tax=uncultured Roseibium sp. TaxID=1936171 RepID=UPI00260A1733|nr:hypothetical protein [uncultured Roseibium sp.]
MTNTDFTYDEKTYLETLGLTVYGDVAIKNLPGNDRVRVEKTGDDFLVWVNGESYSGNDFDRAVDLAVGMIN